MIVNIWRCTWKGLFTLKMQTTYFPVMKYP